MPLEKRGPFQKLHTNLRGGSYSGLKWRMSDHGWLVRQGAFDRRGICGELVCGKRHPPVWPCADGRGANSVCFCHLGTGILARTLAHIDVRAVASTTTLLNPISNTCFPKSGVAHRFARGVWIERARQILAPHPPPSQEPAIIAEHMAARTAQLAAHD